MDNAVLTLDRTLDHYVDIGAVPLLYARLEDADGNLLYEHAAVNESLLPDTSIDGDTWIRIRSMSKPVSITPTRGSAASMRCFVGKT